MRRRSIKTRIAIWFSKRNNRRSFLFHTKIIIFLVLSISLVWGALHSPLLSIRSAKISIESNIDKELQKEVMLYVNSLLDTYSYGIKGGTRYLFKRGTIEDMILEKFLQINSVNIRSKFLNVWNIEIQKREVFGTFCKAEECFFVDTQGVVFGSSDMQIGTSIKVRGTPDLGEVVFTGSSESSMRDFNALVESVRYLEENGLFVDGVEVLRDSRAVNINLNNGITVLLDASETVYNTTRALHLAFNEVLDSEQKRNKIVSVNVRDPLGILYEER